MPRKSRYDNEVNQRMAHSNNMLKPVLDSEGLIVNGSFTIIDQSNIASILEMLFKKYGKSLKQMDKVLNARPKVLDYLENFRLVQSKVFHPDFINYNLIAIAYVIIHNTKLQKLVCSCNSNNLLGFKTFVDGFNEFCGSNSSCATAKVSQATKLSNWNAKLTKKQKQANAIKAANTYNASTGFSNPMHNPTVLNTIQTNSMNANGTLWPIQAPVAQSKITATTMANHGVARAFQSPTVRAKGNATFKINHPNVDRMYFARKGFLDANNGKNPGVVYYDDIDKIMYEKYGVRKPLQVQEIYDKMVDDFSKDNGGRTNPGQLHFTDEQLALLNNKEEFAEIATGRCIRGISIKIGVGDRAISNYVVKHNLEHVINRNVKSLMEEDFCEFLNELGVQYKRNDRNIIKPLELDVLFEDEKIAVEFHGYPQHTEIKGKKSEDYHYNKWLRCKNSGITLYQFFQDEYWINREIIFDKFRKLFGKIDNRIGARQCKLIVPKRKDVELFLEKNHIQGFVGAYKYAFAASYNNEIVAIMTFKENDGKMTLTRFATKLGMQISGMFDRLINCFKEKTKFSGMLHSFSDNRHSDGSIYSKNGWTQSGFIRYNYEYLFQGTGKRVPQRELRLAVHVKKGVDTLDMTEKEFNESLGYDRIWDAGKIQWSKVI